MRNTHYWPVRLGALALLGVLGSSAGSVHAMLPGEMMGEMPGMPEGQLQQEAASGASPLVCVQRTDPATGTLQYITATLGAASQLGATSMTPGPCGGARSAGRQPTRYGIGYLPETLLRGGIPQSVLQTVIQVILSVFSSVFRSGAALGVDLHA